MVKLPYLRYQGSKQKIAKWIFSKINNRGKFIDLFGGGGSMTLFASYLGCYDNIIYNDFNFDVSNFFKQCRDNHNKLIELLKMTPYSRCEFLSARKFDGDLIEKARKMFVVQEQSFRSLGQDRDYWQISKSNNAARTWQNSRNKIDHLSTLLSDVDILSMDAIKVVSMHDGLKSFFYADPPYVPNTLVANTGYKYDLSHQGHVDLCTSLIDCKGNCAISGYDNELYNNLLSNWSKYEITHYTTLGRSGDQSRTECLWVKNPFSFQHESLL